MDNKVREYQAVLTVSSEGHRTLEEAMVDLRKGITKKVKKMKEEGDVDVVDVSHSSSYSDSVGYFASATIVVDVYDPFAALMSEESKSRETTTDIDA